MVIGGSKIGKPKCGVDGRGTMIPQSRKQWKNRTKLKTKQSNKIQKPSTNLKLTIAIFKCWNYTERNFLENLDICVKKN